MNNFEEQLSAGIPTLNQFTNELKHFDSNPNPNKSFINDSTQLVRIIDACLVNFDFSNENSKHLNQKAAKRMLLKIIIDFLSF